MTSVSVSTTPATKDVSAERPFGALQREINRLFSTMDFGWPAFGDLGFRPTIDVTENGSDIRISMELPGLEEKDVKVSLSGDMLIVSGEKKRESEETTDRRHVIERSFGSFERSILLPQGVKPEDVDASMKKGVLTIKVKKAAVARPETKAIDIKTAT